MKSVGRLFAFIVAIHFLHLEFTSESYWCTSICIDWVSIESYVTQVSLWFLPKQFTQCLHNGLSFTCTVAEDPKSA